MRSCAEPIGPHRRRTETSRPASGRSRACVAEGLTNAEMARRLYISPSTAAVHVSNILAKLGMASRAEVAAWAVRSGLAAASEMACASRSLMWFDWCHQRKGGGPAE